MCLGRIARSTQNIINIDRPQKIVHNRRKYELRDSSILFFKGKKKEETIKWQSEQLKLVYHAVKGKSWETLVKLHWISPMDYITWHSYVPLSLSWTYFIWRVQSSEPSGCNTWNRSSFVYVNMELVKTWKSRRRIHDIWNMNINWQSVIMIVTINI